MIQQLDRLSALMPQLPPADYDTAASLIERGRQYGLTSAQLGLVSKLIARASGEPEARVDNFAGIIALFLRASESLKYPKIRLRTSDGYTICLGVAGERSRYPGAINLTDGGGYHDGTWWGRIERDGRVTLSQHGDRIRASLLDLLAQLSADPAGTAAAYGKLTGNCTFCNSRLADEKSTAVGYGPTCAKSFGLPWGTAAAAQARAARVA